MNYQHVKNHLGIYSSLLFLALFLPIAISTHTGYKEQYINIFVLASFIASLVPALLNKSPKRGLFDSIGLIVFVAVLTTGFWWYHDLPKQTYCDATNCEGQFSFENSLDYSKLFLAGFGGSILGIFVRLIFSKYVGMKSTPARMNK